MTIAHSNLISDTQIFYNRISELYDLAQPHQQAIIDIIRQYVTFQNAKWLHSRIKDTTTFADMLFAVAYDPAKSAGRSVNIAIQRSCLDHICNKLRLYSAFNKAWNQTNWLFAKDHRPFANIRRNFYPLNFIFSHGVANIFTASYFAHNVITLYMLGAAPTFAMLATSISFTILVLEYSYNIYQLYKKDYKEERVKLLREFEKEFKNIKQESNRDKELHKFLEGRELTVTSNSRKKEISLTPKEKKRRKIVNNLWFAANFIPKPAFWICWNLINFDFIGAALSYLKGLSEISYKQQRYIRSLKAHDQLTDEVSTMELKCNIKDNINWVSNETILENLYDIRLKREAIKLHNSFKSFVSNKENNFEQGELKMLDRYRNFLGKQAKTTKNTAIKSDLNNALKYIRRSKEEAIEIKQARIQDEQTTFTRLANAIIKQAKLDFCIEQPKTGNLEIKKLATKATQKTPGPTSIKG